MRKLLMVLAIIGILALNATPALAGPHEDVWATGGPGCGTWM